MTPPPPWRVAVGAGAFAAGVAVAPFGSPAGAALSVAAAAVAAATGGRRRLLFALVAGVLCAAGFARGEAANATATGPHSIAGHLGARAVVLRGTVADAGVPGRDDTLAVDVTAIGVAGTTWAATGTVVAEPLARSPALPGDLVEVQVPSLRAPAHRPGALSAAALERLGVTAVAPAATVTLLAAGGLSVARVAELLRRALTGVVTRVLPEPEATLLLGIAFGVHGRLTSSVRATLQDAGLVHLVAVSGLKVVMVAGLLASLAGALGWPRRRRVVVTLAVITGYVLLSGAGAAAIRASLTAGCGLLVARDGRRPDAFALLALCAAAMLGYSPQLASDVGFQLSFLGTLGILLLAAPLAAVLPGPRLFAEPFAVTVAATVASAPVTAGAFGVLSLVGPLANAVVLPLVPAIIVLGGAGALAGAVVPAVGWAPLQVAALGVRIVTAGAQGFAALPLASISVGLWPAAWTVVEVATAAAGAAAWALRSRLFPGLDRSRTLLAAAAAGLCAGGVSGVAASTITPGTLRVTVLNVGAGTALLLAPPEGGTVLVDGGGDGAALLAALGRSLSPLDRHLDAVVLTATNHATAGALPALLGHYDVASLLVSQPLPPALQTVAAELAGAGARVLVAGAGAWRLGGMVARCLPSGPDPAAPCALVVSGERSRVVVTGGLAQVAQDELAAVQRERLRCDLLVGPSTTAPSAALLAAAAPAELAVPALRTPPGVASLRLDTAITGRDGDLVYSAATDGGFVADTGTG